MSALASQSIDDLDAAIGRLVREERGMYLTEHLSTQPRSIEACRP